jgi:hypothetical protein
VKYSYRLIIDQQPALDQKWFDMLLDIGKDRDVIGLSKELFMVLGPPHEELERYRSVFEKIPFNPDLRPRNVDTGGLVNSLKRLRSLKRQILETEESQAVRQAYTHKIDEIIIQNELLVTAATGNKDGFAEANVKLYGTPDKKVFAAVCDWLRRYAAEHAESEIENIRSTSQALLETLPKPRGNQHHIIPRNNVFRQVRALHFAEGGYFSQLFGDEPLPEFVDASVGDPVTRRAIEAIGSDYTVADSTDELWGVIHSGKCVVRPPGYRLPLPDFKGIVAHEVGSHLLERMNGRRQPLRLLEIGLDRYDWGNEGRAFLREQIVYNSPYDMLRQPGWEYITLKHMAISLAAGLHGKPYGFKALYDAMYPVCHFFQALRRPDNPVYAESVARSEVWHLLVRVLKGTDGFGGAYMKDIIYLEGNVRAWKQAAADPAYILFGDSGKFDIARPDHRRLLAALGIKPQLTRRFTPALPSFPVTRPHHPQLRGRLSLRRRS